MACLSENISNEMISSMQEYLNEFKESFIAVIDKTLSDTAIYGQRYRRFRTGRNTNGSWRTATNGFIRKKNLQQINPENFESNEYSGLFRVFMNEFISDDAYKCTQLAKYEKKVRKVEEAFAIVCDKWCR